jgi:hypothetical protein
MASADTVGSRPIWAFTWAWTTKNWEIDFAQVPHLQAHIAGVGHEKSHFNTSILEGLAVEILMVPIHLDALYLNTDRSVVEAMADFSRLPYSNGAVDINPDTANLSEEILSQPFQDRRLQLKAGIHLHWALPDALTTGFQDRETRKLVFPAVPNRWLVTRTDAASQIKQWIVESNYLAPPDTLRQGSISYPCETDATPQPFRYTGRSMPFEAWNSKGGNSQYLDKLTAIGYGEPTFAAFYPSCLSVFGFYDEAPPTTLTGLQYDIIGWYSDPAQDCLQVNESFKDPAVDQYDALKAIYKWIVENHGALPPNRTICHAHLIFDPAGWPVGLPEEREVAVAIGNTSTEALSAYCSRIKTLAKGDPSEFEDRLEAVLLAGRLEGVKVDTGPKFKEARHNKEFTGIAAGTLWAIRPESAAPSRANAHESASFSQKDLPSLLADQLHRLNIRQQTYDQDCDDIESMRKQLFADWYKYMLCAYPPEGNRDQYPSMDEVKYFLEKSSLYPLKQRIAKNRAMDFELKQAAADLYRAVADLQLLSMEDVQDWVKFRALFQPAPPASIALGHIFA